jgi:SAM-dependent methyltransferase
VTRATTSVSHYDAQYYARRQCSPLSAEIKAITTLLDPRPSDRILEVGCGGGALLSHLAALGPRDVVGVDWLRTSVELVRQSGAQARVLQGDACALPFSDATFDKVVAQHLIEHFEDTNRVLSEWRRVLRPGGLLVIVTPNLGFPHQEWFADPTHRRIFSKTELREHLVRAEYAVKEIRIINPYVGSLSVQFAAARHLQFMRRLPWFGDHGMSLVAAAERL